MPLCFYLAGFGAGTPQQEAVPKGQEFSRIENLWPRDDSCSHENPYFLNNLSAEEQRVFEQLMEEEPPEDALAFFAQLYDDAPKEQTSETVNISENEIYFKRKPLTEEQKKHSSYVDENGNLHVKNLSAFWIPELTTTEKVGHTTYTVTGSYEGKESFLKKLERIVAKYAHQKFEDEGADE